MFDRKPDFTTIKEVDGIVRFDTVPFNDVSECVAFNDVIDFLIHNPKNMSDWKNVKALFDIIPEYNIVVNIDDDCLSDVNDFKEQMFLINDDSFEGLFGDIFLSISDSDELLSGDFSNIDECIDFKERFENICKLKSIDDNDLSGLVIDFSFDSDFSFTYMNQFVLNMFVNWMSDNKKVGLMISHFDDCNRFSRFYILYEKNENVDLNEFSEYLKSAIADRPWINY